MYYDYQYDLALLDCFDKNFELIAPDREMYELFTELYQRFLAINDAKSFQDSAKDFNEASNLDIITNEKIAQITVKVEVGRNIEKYPFRQFMSDKEKAELQTFIEPIFEKIGIQGRLFQYREVFNMQNSLRLIDEQELYKIQESDYVFIPIDRR